MAQLRGGRGFLPERFNIVAKMEITFQLPCFRVEYIDPLVYSRSRIFSPLKGGGAKIFPREKRRNFPRDVGSKNTSVLFAYNENADSPCLP